MDNYFKGPALMSMCVKKLGGMMENKTVFKYDLKAGLTINRYLIKNNNNICINNKL